MHLLPTHVLNGHYYITCNAIFNYAASKYCDLWWYVYLHIWNMCNNSFFVQYTCDYQDLDKFLHYTSIYRKMSREVHINDIIVAYNPK